MQIRSIFCQSMRQPRRQHPFNQLHQNPHNRLHHNQRNQLRQLRNHWTKALSPLKPPAQSPRRAC